MRSALRRTGLFAVLLALATAATGGEPPGYYVTVDTTDATTLRATLHAVIDDHQRFPYTSTGTDTWDILELADEDPANATRIVDVYRNASFEKLGAGGGGYNREHTWPNSYGFPDDGADNYPYTDCHQLRLSDEAYNTARSTRPYGTASAAATEYPTVLTNGTGGGSGVYVGNSNWGTGSGATGVWETWADQRGDVARGLLYLDVRYEGGVHGITGQPEPDLVLTDNTTLIAASATGSNGSLAYMGLLSVLLQWHAQDPPDDRERDRNDVVYSFQGNRNPFIDHPEWVSCLFESTCGGDITPPAAPTGLMATSTLASVDLDWDDNVEPDLAGYSVLRGTLPGGPYSDLAGGLVVASDYSDTTALSGTTYVYVVTAADLSGNDSLASNEVSGGPTGGGGGPVLGTPWINELHYDNAGTDSNEFVELAGPAGLDLTGYALVAYNGATGAQYLTVALAGTLPEQQECLGTLAFDVVPLQNGSPDGVALVDPLGTVLQFLSYEGAFSAVDGPASGQLSTDIFVAETGVTPVGESLQLGGTGSGYGQFTWDLPQAHTRGQPNAGQTFTNPVFSSLGGGLGGTLGEPTLDGCGALTGGSTVTLTVDNALPASTCWLIAGLSLLGAPFKGGTLVPNPDLVLPLPTGSGAFSLPTLWPMGLPAGIPLWFQFWVSDPGGPKNLAATNGLTASTS